MGQFANAASIANRLPRVPIELLLRWAWALRPARAAPKLAGHLKMLELAMTRIAAIQGGFVRS
jgi:hypothetical protein